MFVTKIKSYIAMTKSQMLSPGNDSWHEALFEVHLQAVNSATELKSQS